MTKVDERRYAANPNDYPMYGIRDGARYLKIPPATLRAWFAGTNRGAFRRVLTPARSSPVKLSFNNLAEAYVLHSLRTRQRVQLAKVRAAIKDAERALGIDRLLLRRDLKTHAGQILIERFGEYLTLGESGQLAMKAMLDAALDRFVWERDDFPSRLFPQIPVTSAKIIAIDPRRSFGAPHVASRGVTTAIISSRCDAGESIGQIAGDYRLSEEEVRAALVYEQAA